jgi:hypothetical protein
MHPLRCLTLLPLLASANFRQWASMTVFGMPHIKSLPILPESLLPHLKETIRQAKIILSFISIP